MKSLSRLAMSALIGAALSHESAIAQAQKAPLQDVRVTIPLLSDWSFHKGAMEKEAATSADPSATWERVSLPHCWNAKDGADGMAGYFKGDGWYRRALTIPDTIAGKQLFLKFEGANRRSEVFVNGQSVGKHVGGTQAFVCDITGVAKAGDNQLVVHVDNKDDPDSAPLSADFTFWGGIYRPVELIAVDPLHVALSDFGSPGVYITTPEVTATQAKVQVRTLMENHADVPMFPAVVVSIFDRDGKKVASETPMIAQLQPKSRDFYVCTLAIDSPHLWNGRIDPYLYTVKINVRDNRLQLAPTVDVVSQPLGIRTIAMDLEKGLILNGKPYSLHGVNRHQDREGKGWAISNADHDEDMAIIKEMGCTGIRLAHYQHSEYFYQLCDKEGMVVWAEIPVVNRLGSSQAFTDNARQQYTELIRQNFNHPSIVFWSAGNEVDDSGGLFNKNGPQVYPWFKKMGELGKREDPSRFTAAAYREKFFPPADTTDVFGMNIYLGWYNNTFDEIEQYIEKHHANGAKGKWAVTEYGAGSSIFFHSEKPVRMDHTEEYQALYHEKNWAVLKQHPEIWGEFIWNMFDFGVDGRFEGDRGGINDKGLVTYDRKVKKDAFYFYKASWSDEPTLWLTSKRFEVRGTEKIPVKAYSNAKTVSLMVNGAKIGEKVNENATFSWEDVSLKPGQNVVAATATFADGKTLTDTATWTYTPGAPMEVYVAQDPAMKKALEAGPPRVDFPRRPAGSRPSSRPASRPGQ